MVIAIIGASGFIGNRIFHSLSIKNTFNLIGTFYKHKTSSEFIHLDVTSIEQIKQFLIRYRPSLIFWLAGSKNLNECENDIKYAYRINTQPIIDFYQIKKRINLDSRLVFFSTDYVFDGVKGNYKDNDVGNPKTNYGIANKLAEDAIRHGSNNDLIIRTSAAMGRGGQFFDWLTKSLVDDKEVKMFNDIFFSPTPIQLLSEATEYLINHRRSGIIHICGGLRLSRFEFAKILLGINKTFSATIVPISASNASNPFQNDLSLIKSNICEKFQTKDFENYIREELLS